MQKLLPSVIFCFLLFLFITPTYNSIIASHKVFQDNFDDENANGWIVTRNTCLFNETTAEWKVVNGRLGIKINGGGCSTHIMPNDSLWNSLGNDYIVEFDMNLVSGTDHNFAFRYTNPENWYDFHIQSPNNLIMERMLPPTGGSNNILGNFSNNQTIHFKLIVEGDHATLYRKTEISQTLLYDNLHMGNFFQNGRIALIASAGGDPASETYFDNIVVTNIDGPDGDTETLNVPYFSQNGLPWGPTEYDHALSLGFANSKFERWGCAVTSAAMVLNYHGIKRFGDNSLIDPGSLNNWLKNNKGYSTGFDKDGPFSYLKWPSISSLTKQLFMLEKAPIALEHAQYDANSSTTDLLNNDLKGTKIPDILFVKNSQTDGHFVVAKGITDATYAINDPEWNYPTLTSFNNSYMQLDRYFPSHTNLSYLMLVGNKSVEFLVTNQNGQKTGKQYVNGQLQTFNEIPNAKYGFQAPISNPTPENVLQQFGTGTNVFLLPKAPDGEYTVQVSSKMNEIYNLNIDTYQLDGQDLENKFAGFTNSNNQKSFKIKFFQTQQSSIASHITFQTVIDDVNEARQLDLITHKSLIDNLLQKIQQVQKAELENNTEQLLHRLDQFVDILNGERGKRINEIAYQILLYDITTLKATIIP